MGSISKQGLIGIAMMFGSGIILFALSEPSTTPTVNAGSEEEQIVAEPLYKVAPEQVEVQLEPVDKDVAEQAKIVQQQQQQRAELVKAQEQKSRELLEAHEKSQKAKTDVATQEEVKDSTQTNEDTQTKSEIKKAESKPQPPAQPATYTVQEGDYLGKLASQHGMSAEVLAEANDMHVSQAVKQGQRIKIPSVQQVASIKLKVKKNQAYRKAQIEAKQQAQVKQEKPTPTQPTKQATNTTKPAKEKPKAKAKFGVEVAYGTDEEGAKSVVKKLRNAGYGATIRKTNDGGYRIIVGPARGRENAQALMNKVSNDSRVTTKGAWLVNW